MTDTLGSLPVEAKQYYDKKLLERAKPLLKMVTAGQQRNLPKNSGNQVSYRRFNQISTSTTPLAEGVTPVASSLSITEITGTAAQYGNYVQVSDALDMLGIDPVIREATMVLGENGAQSIEEIVRAELVTGTSVIYGTGSARNAQSAANPISLTLVRRAVRTLQANDAEGYSSKRDDMGQGQMYLGFIHPRQWFDLTGDTTVLNTFTYSDPEKLYTLKLPSLAQVAWCVTSRAPVFTGAGSGAADVYGAIIVSENAFGVVNVASTGTDNSSGTFSTIVKPIGSAGAADPLDQRGTIGWKAYQLPKILNNNFMTRIETGVTA